MLAVAPTSVLEGTENPGWRRERGPSTEAGVPRLSQGIDRGEKATFGGDRRMGAGCTFTQAPMETTMRSSTSTTKFYNPESGFGCSSERDCAADCRYSQKPTDVKYRPTPDEANPTSWIGSWGHYGPAGQSAYRPHTNACLAGDGCFVP